MALSQEERDSRSAALSACKRVQLYPASMSIGEFVARGCGELVAAEELECPIGPLDYTDGLRLFRSHYRRRLEEQGYSGFRVYLQRLCDHEPGEPDLPASWAYWCRYHAEQL